MPLSDVHLVLFLTAGTTLQDWARSGLLEREAELYLRLRPQLGSISWVSYGGPADLELAEHLPGIDILINRWRLPNQVYIQQLPWLHRAAFERATILKAEQTGAAEAALRIAQHYGKRFIARSGFSWALFAAYDPKAYETRYEAILGLERRVFQAAQRIVMTTEEMREAALQNHALSPECICVIPNYVNTQRFTPPEKPPRQPRILFVGRLTGQKNVDLLLSAVAPLTHVHVEFIGEGELRGHLEQRIRTEGLSHVHLLGNRPNSALAEHMQQATVYAQPSRYEGHPKTIFEAMACGLPVVTTDAPGIRQFIRHSETGWLSDMTTESIREGLETLLADAALRERLGKAAREYVVSHYALDAIVPQEIDLLKSVYTLPAPTAQPEPRPWLRSGFTYAERAWRLVRRRIVER
ncbi:MAG: glycosyltransferase family 4 protein [Anaerolineales bacterium]